LLLGKGGVPRKPSCNKNTQKLKKNDYRKGYYSSNTYEKQSEERMVYTYLEIN
jgi:hypothetical protein